MLVVNAEFDSMGGVGIPQSSDLEKTQAELRQSFTAAEKFRKELEFLQKGGDPLDLKPGNAASVSFQSTSLKDRHPDQFVTSEANGSFADSVESSGRLGAPSVCEPNSADNLMLLKESGDSALLELPKKSYKRRVRSRPSRDLIRQASKDFKALTHDAVKYPIEGVPAVQSGPAHGSLAKSGGEEAPLITDSKEPESESLKGPTNGNTEEIKIIPGPTKVLDSESSCTQTGQHFNDYNGNGLLIEQNLGSDKLGAEKTDKILNIDPIINEDSPAIKEGESLKESESIKDAVGPNANDNLKLATKEYEDSILEEARVIEAKRKRIAGLSVRNLLLERRVKSHWDFVLEEMSWLANDFAQERLWKVATAAQVSRRVAFASRVKLQQQSFIQKQKALCHTLAEAVMQFWHVIQVKCKGPESQCTEKVGINGYAMRFMEYNSSRPQYNAAQAPMNHDVISDLAVMDHSWEDNLTEENLFYTVAPGAIEAYRKAIDSHLQQIERTGSSMQEEVDTSCYDAVADNAFDEDEGETNTYYFPASKSTKAAQKRRKNFKFYGPRSYEPGADVAFTPSVLSGKRPGSSLNVTIPTKRVRTAPRQRVISSFNAGTSSHIHALNRTDGSSADTSSFQDEQSTLHGGPGSQMPNNMEAESAGDYEKHLGFDSMEVSNRPKKKKKEKHHGSTFDHRWQLDSNFQTDQRDHIRRRLDGHQFDSNGSSVASQMSNMSNPNKFMKLLVRDHGRKVKAHKTTVGQPGSGSPWSLFEDQALVVLVHDMGPNWELISDAMNSSLQFKCIFRKANECKERHKILMDMNTGDGADSAEDSGSSQPYQSTLPGIPEGSARQLFQRLQGPMEEETLKSHFEKIIIIGQKQHYRRKHNDHQHPKQSQPPHGSHAVALSQVCPNNLNGGPVLTPLELCEAISSSPDVLPAGYQGPHNGGPPPLNHSPTAPMLPGSGSGSTSSAPGSSNSVREGRQGISRTGSLSVDDQQRMQQYNRMLAARNAQQASLPPGSHSATDRGVRLLPAGSGMGVMCGVNRNMKMPRPGFPGPSGMHAGPGPGNSMLRSRDPMKVSQSGTAQGVPPFGSPQQSPHMLNHPHHFQGPPNPAFAMRLAKERQLQHRLLQQQQQQFSASNPVLPPVQPQESQLSVASSAQSTAAAPKHPGLVRNPQTSGNQLVKQPRPGPPQQHLPPQQQQAKLRGNLMSHQNLPTENGFPGSSSLSQTHQQKTFSGQTQAASLKNPNPNPNTNPNPGGSSNHQPSQKLVNQKQATASQKLLLLNRKVNSSDETRNQTESSTPVINANNPETSVSSLSAPKPSGVGTDSEQSGPPMNQVNPVEHDVGV